MRFIYWVLRRATPALIRTCWPGWLCCWEIVCSTWQQPLSGPTAPALVGFRGTRLSVPTSVTSCFSSSLSLCTSPHATRHLWIEQWDHGHVFPVARWLTRAKVWCIISEKKSACFSSLDFADVCHRSDGWWGPCWRWIAMLGTFGCSFVDSALVTHLLLLFRGNFGDCCF